MDLEVCGTGSAGSRRRSRRSRRGGCRVSTRRGLDVRDAMHVDIRERQERPLDDVYAIICFEDLVRNTAVLGIGVTCSWRYVRAQRLTKTRHGTIARNGWPAKDQPSVLASPVRLAPRLARHSPHHAVIDRLIVQLSDPYTQHGIPSTSDDRAHSSSSREPQDRASGDTA